MSNLAGLREDLTGYLYEIEAYCERAGIPMSRLTLVARDPSNPEMFLVLTNEPEADWPLVAELVTRNAV